MVSLAETLFPHEFTNYAGLTDSPTIIRYNNMHLARPLGAQKNS